MNVPIILYGALYSFLKLKIASIASNVRERLIATYQNLMSDVYVCSLRMSSIEIFQKMISHNFAF